MIPDEVLGGIAEGLIGAIAGFSIAFFAFRIQRQRKTIVYDIQAMSLLRFQPDPEQNQPLSVMVSEESLTGDPNHRDSSVTVHSAYAFEVSLANTGNQHVDTLVVEVWLDENAKIVDFESEPSPTQAYAIAGERDEAALNMVRFNIPYINSRQEVMLKIVSVENTGEGCGVEVYAPGIRVKRRRTTSWLEDFAVAILSFLSPLSPVPLIEVTRTPPRPRD